MACIEDVVIFGPYKTNDPNLARLLEEADAAQVGTDASTKIKTVEAIWDYLDEQQACRLSALRKRFG